MSSLCVVALSALLPTSLLLGPAPARRSSLLPACTRAALPQMCSPPRSGEAAPALDEAAAAEPRRGWRRRLRTAGSTAATALALMGSGRALAAPAAEAPAAAAAAVAAAHTTAPPPLPTLRLGRAARKQVGRFKTKEFLFSEALVAKDELEDELIQLDLEEAGQVSPLLKASRGAVFVGGSIGMCYYAVKSASALEAWMREDERRDIEDEIESTGTFISAYAGDVETTQNMKVEN